MALYIRYSFVSFFPFNFFRANFHKTAVQVHCTHIIPTDHFLLQCFDVPEISGADSTGHLYKWLGTGAP